MFQKIQKPSDCAFLITAPLTEKSFRSDLHNPHKDFVKNWAANQRLASDEELTDANLWEIYAYGVSGFILKTAEEIKLLGATVIFDAKLSDLSQILTERKVVTLEAHWFTPKLEVEDFFCPESFVEQFTKANNLFIKALREALLSSGFEVNFFAKTFDKHNFPDLVRAINRVLSNYNTKDRVAEPIFVPSENQTRNEEVWIQLNRFEIENAFPGEVKRRCGVEMFDGLCSLEEFRSRIPADFNGVIDLTVCNSEVAGKFVKQTRNDALVMTNRFVTDLKLRLILYKGVMRLLREGQCSSYIDAVFNLRKQLIEINRRKR
jgi:hypothetical protein